MTKKVPLTIELDGRKTVVGTAEVNEDDMTVVNAVIDPEYSYLIEDPKINSRGWVSESPKDKALREEVERHNVFKDHQLRGGEHNG